MHTKSYTSGHLDDAECFQSRKSVSWKEYMQKYAEPSIKKEIRIPAIMAYICVAVSFFSIFLFFIRFRDIDWLGLIYAFLLAGLTLGMHLRKSRVCAVLLFILSCIAVSGKLASGEIPPIIFLIAGIGTVVAFIKAGKQYKNFISGNTPGNDEKSKSEQKKARIIKNIIFVVLSFLLIGITLLPQSDDILYIFSHMDDDFFQQLIKLISMNLTAIIEVGFCMYLIH